MLREINIWFNKYKFNQNKWLYHLCIKKFINYWVNDK